jgi:hypothetical protein
MTLGGHDERPPSLKWPGSALLQSQGAEATLMRPRFSSGSSSKCAGLCFRLCHVRDCLFWCRFSDPVSLATDIPSCHFSGYICSRLAFGKIALGFW